MLIMSVNDKLDNYNPKLFDDVMVNTITKDDTTYITYTFKDYISITNILKYISQKNNHNKYLNLIDSINRKLKKNKLVMLNDKYKPIILEKLSNLDGLSYPFFAIRNVYLKSWLHIDHKCLILGDYLYLLELESCAWINSN